MNPKVQNPSVFKSSLSLCTRRFFDECGKKRLFIQRCKSCKKPRHYPRILCPKCSSTEFEWFESGGMGAVYSYTVVYRAPSAAFKDCVPYIIALVDLDEGVRLMTNIITDSPDEMEIGMRVKLTFRHSPIDEDQKLPMFVPEDRS